LISGELKDTGSNLAILFLYNSLPITYRRISTVENNSA
jgi:hypothetical protein